MIDVGVVAPPVVGAAIVNFAVSIIDPFDVVAFAEVATADEKDVDVASTAVVVVVVVVTPVAVAAHLTGN